MFVPGDLIEWNNERFIVLEKREGDLFCLSYYCSLCVPFYGNDRELSDAYKIPYERVTLSNNYSKSYVKFVLENSMRGDKIFTTDLTSDIGDSSYGFWSGSIGLLTRQQYEKWKDIIPPTRDVWWLATPKSDSLNNKVFVVDGDTIREASVDSLLIKARATVLLSEKECKKVENPVEADESQRSGEIVHFAGRHWVILGETENSFLCLSLECIMMCNIHGKNNWEFSEVRKKLNSIFQSIPAKEHVIDGVQCNDSVFLLDRVLYAKYSEWIPPVKVPWFLADTKDDIRQYAVDGDSIAVTYSVGINGIRVACYVKKEDAVPGLDFAFLHEYKEGAFYVLNEAVCKQKSDSIRGEVVTGSEEETEMFSWVIDHVGKTGIAAMNMTTFLLNKFQDDLKPLPDAWRAVEVLNGGKKVFNQGIEADGKACGFTSGMVGYRPAILFLGKSRAEVETMLKKAGTSEMSLF